MREPSAKFLVGPRYKRSAVGTIPADWGDPVFGHLYSEPSRNGIYKTSEFHGRGTRIVNMGEMFGLEFISDQEMNRVELTSRELAVSSLKDGDLLFGRRSVVPSGAGKCSMVVLPTEPITFESSIIRVRLDNSIVCPRFYYYFFASPIGRTTVGAIVAGTNVKGIRATELRELTIPLPTKAEQEAIAEALSDADALIESLDQLVAKKRQIKQGTMQELLTGKRRLPGFSGEWVLKRLGEIANIKTGARNNQDKVEDGAYPFFVRSSTVERINSFSHDCEAILIPGEGGIGSIFHYVFGKFDVHQRVYAITRFSSETSGKFVYFYMATKFGAHAMENSVKATVDSLRLPTFLDFEITMPPTFDEQTAIAAVLRDMDAELSTLESRLAKARQIKQGMMQELLTGRIRLL